LEVALRRAVTEAAVPRSSGSRAGVLQRGSRKVATPEAPRGVTQRHRRSKDSGLLVKVTDLGRDGRLERVKPAFPLGKL